MRFSAACVGACAVSFGGSSLERVRCGDDGGTDGLACGEGYGGAYGCADSHPGADFHTRTDTFAGAYFYPGTDACADSHSDAKAEGDQVA